MPLTAEEWKSRTRALLQCVNPEFTGKLFGDVLHRYLGEVPGRMPFHDLVPTLLGLPWSPWLWCFRSGQYQVVDEVDVMVGGLPCVDASPAGLELHEHGRTAHVVGTFIREVLEMQPKVIILENVPDVVS